MKYLHALNLLPHVGRKTLINLVQKFDSAKNAWNASAQDLRHAGVSEQHLPEILHKRDTINTDEEWEKIEKQAIQIVSFQDENYPKLLKEIYDFPALLYYRGAISSLVTQPTIAIVGTRKPSDYGRQVAWQLAKELAQNGIAVVSGLALGLDSVAHEGTLEGNGITVGVLGSGISDANITPQSHRNLAHKIIEKDGAILSEYPPDAQATPGTFPARNRIIAGLSLGTLVVEAAKKSGTLITARCALDYNREVFATPGSIFSPNSEGANHLIQEGAQLVTSINDILESLDLFAYGHTSQQDSLFGFDISTLSEEEKTIYTILSKEPLPIETIVRSTKMPSSLVSTHLSMLEIQGAIKDIGNGRYVRM